MTIRTGRRLGVLLLGLLMLLGICGCGLADRVRQDNGRRDDTLDGPWVGAAMQRVIDTDGAISAMLLRQSELQITGRSGDRERTWTITPQDIARAGDWRPIQLTNGPMVPSRFNPQTMVDALVGYANQGRCRRADVQVQLDFTWTGWDRRATSCTAADVNAFTSYAIGTRLLTSQSSLRSTVGLETVFGDLALLAPESGITQLRLELTATAQQGCSAELSWPQETPAGAYLIRQQRGCWTLGDQAVLPSVASPLTGTEPAQHLFGLDQITLPALERITGQTGLPSTYPVAETITIGWDEHFGQVVIAATAQHGTWYFTLDASPLGSTQQ